jgi:hypothetical protein
MVETIREARNFHGMLDDNGLPEPMDPEAMDHEFFEVARTLAYSWKDRPKVSEDVRKMLATLAEKVPE